MTSMSDRQAQFQEQIIVLNRAAKWIEKHLDSFPNVPGIIFFGMRVQISFGHLMPDGETLMTLKQLFGGQTAQCVDSLSTTAYELRDSISGLEFVWYVFNPSSSDYPQSEVVI